MTSRDWLDEQYPRCTMLVYGGEYPVRCDRAPVRDGMCARHADAVDARDRKGAHADWKRAREAVWDANSIDELRTAADKLGELMTASARTAETNFADALAEFFANVGDTDNAEYWVKRLEGSFPSPIIDVRTTHSVSVFSMEAAVLVSFEDDRMLHLTVTQIKEPNQ